jgi:hypothetical protein
MHYTNPKSRATHSHIQALQQQLKSLKQFHAITRHYSGSIVGMKNGVQKRQSNIAWPLPKQVGTCVVVHDFISTGECRSYINLAENRGFGSAESDYLPSYRNNDRLVFEDRDMAAAFEQRIRRALQQHTDRDEDMAAVLSPHTAGSLQA